MRTQTTRREGAGFAFLTWACVALVIFTIIAIYDRPDLSALAALAAVVLGQVRGL